VAGVMKIKWLSTKHGVYRIGGKLILFGPVFYQPDSDWWRN